MTLGSSGQYLRDPTHPVEVAYFKPGDACMSHVRYVPGSGQIWFACQDSGFWVIALKSELRASLGMPKLTATRMRKY